MITHYKVTKYIHIGFMEYYVPACNQNDGSNTLKMLDNKKKVNCKNCRGTKVFRQKCKWNKWPLEVVKGGNAYD